MSEPIISTDKSKLNVHFIHEFISNSYWAKGRTLNEVKKSIAHSVNFGIYKNGIQIGYARVVTDFIVFAYLMDVFIVDTQRGKGYGFKLMEAVFNYNDFKNIQNWKLATSDAHQLYRKFGFETINNPEKMMEKNL